MDDDLEPTLDAIACLDFAAVGLHCGIGNGQSQPPTATLSFPG